MKPILGLKLYAFLTGSLFFLFSGMAEATITCLPENTRTDTLQIKPLNISAGPDLPPGTVLYRGTWRETDWTNLIQCQTTSTNGESGSVNYNLGIETAPYPLSTWSGSPYGGKVYTTNIPGVGIAVWYSFKAVTTSSPLITSANIDITVQNSGTTLRLSVSSAFDFSLVKIGDTPPGNYTIQASSFPVVKRFFTANSTNIKGLPATVRTIVFSGSLNVSAQTCTTPDVNVHLGSHDVSTLTGVGSATPWVDSSIKLTDCPTFRGYYPESNPVNLSTGAIPASTGNKFSVTLSPVNSILNAANGIMAVTPSANAATGVGIQIAHGATSTTGPVPFNLAASANMDLPKNGVGTIIYPLAARYIKTDTSVTPGPADGRIIFTINYY
ncbi:type 1 fimbrial protein (plasmid) [Klebsiella sp. BDA134-6]|uniref:fimbrial protein n=1 Tax=Klebsiella sp. BDA134-6 TaxID=2787706 RepID=UPI0018A055A4|nr:fimbrial protein [Klebsiella sp. BDA134-6]QPF30590.1 type 1 fimbrial protein [Klebsiella sp. BDA134-6]